MPKAWTGKASEAGVKASVEHATVEDAEAWIAEREKVDPEGVHNGDYYLDVETEEAD